jgi:hypothetical protein
VPASKRAVVRVVRGEEQKGWGLVALLVFVQRQARSSERSAPAAAGQQTGEMRDSEDGHSGGQSVACRRWGNKRG